MNTENIEQLTLPPRSHYHLKNMSELEDLIHNLETHKEELEAQNRELEESRIIIENARDRYSDLYDFAPIGYTTLNSKGLIQEINLTGTKILGVERLKIIGQPFIRWVEKNDLPDFRKHIRHCNTDSASPIITEIVLSTNDKKNIYIILQSIKFYSEEIGENVFRTAMIDITERKLLEVERANLLKQEKLARKQLQAANLKLEQERELRERFVYTLTHDLRTPLTAIDMNAQIIIRNKGDSTKAIALATSIINGAHRLDQMIGDLLDANLIHAGQKLSLTVKECNLTKILWETVKEFSATHGDRFLLHSKEKLIGHWNQNLLKRVIENILSNAVKYGSANSPISISTDEINGRVLISIHNEGGELSANEIVAIFGAFKRTKTAQECGAKGWGIGLTLVRGIVEVHGGTIRVESEVGKGTTFVVELPLDSRPFESL